MAMAITRQERGGEGVGDSKAQLVQEICSAGSIFSSCPHRRRPSRSPPFVDWFLLLGVDANEKVDAIGKRYRQLALQLHPDKNKHPRADVAFKLVSEAYACLSDKARRKAFDLERSSSFCGECYNHYANAINANVREHEQQKQQQEEPGSSSNSSSSSSRVMMKKALRQLQKELRDECEVIEGCLRARGGAYWNNNGDFPLFDPCKVQQDGHSSSLWRYPYFRQTETAALRQPMMSMNRCRSSRNIYEGEGRWGRGMMRCESPVYEMGRKKAA